MLPCTDKSTLIHNLEELASTDSIETAGDNEISSTKIAVVDRMVLVQKLTKKKGTHCTVKDLAKSFNDRLTNLTAGFNEVILSLMCTSPTPWKKKLERNNDKERPLYNITLRMIQISNTSLFLSFYHIKKQNQTTLPKQSWITKRNQLSYS